MHRKICAAYKQLVVSKLSVIIGGLWMRVVFVSKLICMDYIPTRFHGDRQRAQINDTRREVHKPAHTIDNGLRHAFNPEMQLVITWWCVTEREGIVWIRYGEKRRWKRKYDRAHLGMNVAKNVGDAYS